MANKITTNDLKILKKKYPNNLDTILKKIKNHYPIQYLIGNVEFYGYKINVDESVLIPRFETEILVEKTLELLKKYNLLNAKVLDMATGSGCIAIALKKELQSLDVFALDYSKKSLQVAKNNAIDNNASINFFHHDILKDNLDDKYDVIISNPPYVPLNQKVDKETIYEPQDAIFASNHGLLFYKTIAKKYQKNLNKKSIIALEINYDQKESVINIFKEYYPNAIIYCQKDYNNFDRFIFILNNCE